MELCWITDLFLSTLAQVAADELSKTSQAANINNGLISASKHVQALQGILRIQTARFPRGVVRWDPRCDLDVTRGITFAFTPQNLADSVMHTRGSPAQEGLQYIVARPSTSTPRGTHKIVHADCRAVSTAL